MALNTELQKTNAKTRPPAAPPIATSAAVDPLEETRALKRLVRIGVYAAILGTEPFYLFVLHYSWPQLLIGLVIGLTIATVAIEGAFYQFFRLRKRAAYPNVLLQALGSAPGIEAAAEQALPIIRQLLRVRAAAVLTGGELNSLRLLSFDGIAADDLGRLLENARAETAGVLARNYACGWFRKRDHDGTDVLANGERAAFVPVTAMTRLLGVLVLVGRKRGSDLGDVELLQAVGTAFGLSIENLADKDALARTASLLSTALESTADGILVVGMDGKIERANGKFIEMWKIPPSIVESRDDDRALQFVLQQLADPEGFMSRVRELYAQPDTESTDTLFFKDGRVFERFSQPRMLNGRNVGRVWTFRDVTETKRAEQALRESEEQFRSIQESALDAIVTMDSDGIITSWNPQAETIFGWSRDEACGRSFAETLIPLHQREAHRDGLAQVLEAGEGPVLNRRTEVVALDRSGREFPAELAVVPLHSGETVSFCAFIRDISERKKAEETIRHLAYHDVLTGLPNRVLFEERLRLALAQARRSRAKLAVMFLDLDRFKLVNDTVGHTGGDQLLQEVAREFADTIREGDTVARVGGDEFTFILPGIDHAEDAIAAAERILQRVRKPRIIGGQEFRITTSIGITVFPRDGSGADVLMRNADTAMYRAKERGRDNYQLYTPAMKATLQEMLALENDLRHALERNELFLLYQPLVNVASGNVIGGEALLRWQHPQRGLVSPEEFIPLAEETGLITPIGEWVLREACEQAKAWQEAGLGHLRVTVNVAARQVEQPGLVSTVGAVLTDTGLAPQRLQLELTEGTVMRHVDSVTSALSKLRGMGVGISVDDFGTGYSSLGYLKRFPIDTIKIDRSFVRDVATDQNDAAIITTVIAMARGLNLRVVAEGVETHAQLGFLRENRCDECQGFLLSPPIPPAEFEALVRQQQEQPATAVPLKFS